MTTPLNLCVVSQFSKTGVWAVGGIIRMVFFQARAAMEVVLRLVHTDNIRVIRTSGVDCGIEIQFVDAVRQHVMFRSPDGLNHDIFADPRIWGSAYCQVAHMLVRVHTNEPATRRLRRAVSHPLARNDLGRRLLRIDRSPDWERYLLQGPMAEALFKHGHGRDPAVIARYEGGSGVGGGSTYPNVMRAHERVKEVIVRRLTDAGASPLVASLVAAQLSPM